MWPFDTNKQQMYQNYANAWDQGTYHQIPAHEVQQNYQQLVQNAPQPMVQELLEQYFQQAPADQRSSLIQQMLSGLVERGINPQQVGIQNTNPSQISAQEAARLATNAPQQQPDLIQQVMSNPLAKTALAGALAYAAKQFLSNRGNTPGSGASSF